MSVRALSMQERETQYRLAHTKENFLLAYITRMSFDLAVQ